jgi:hypothetical protein
MGLAQVGPKDFAPIAQVNFDPAAVHLPADANRNLLPVVSTS